MCANDFVNLHLGNFTCFLHFHSSQNPRRTLTIETGNFFIASGRIYGQQYETKNDIKKVNVVRCAEQMKPNKFMRFYYFNKDLLQPFLP